MREKKPKRRRIEPRELLRRRGVITKGESLSGSGRGGSTSTAVSAAKWWRFMWTSC